MSRQTTIKCDFCGRFRQGLNRWFKVFIRPDMIRIYDTNTGEDTSNLKDACGKSCVIKAIAAWMYKK